MKADTLLLHARKAQVFADELGEMISLLQDSQGESTGAITYPLHATYAQTKMALLKMSIGCQDAALKIAHNEQRQFRLIWKEDVE